MSQSAEGLGPSRGAVRAATARELWQPDEEPNSQIRILMSKSKDFRLVMAVIRRRPDHVTYKPRLASDLPQPPSALACVTCCRELRR
ncbi:hypothetical protein EVAR_5976_1 [Eumeta japonica]|uniref:Uncharacterized protein n=1 Tax=Eumeta variegata TaxID=151549 RepID=A0A4C1TAE6_EUMVA|nr:hypothetical protein EVAR_5976_1 [Eumeta japonica]